MCYQSELKLLLVYLFPTEDGGKQFDARAGVSPGIFGWGFIVRVKVPG